MSILAEPRRKQKISVDPQNLQWKNDDQKLSRKLMEKMGWNDGDGLGKSRQGNADAVKLKANYGNKGLGADKMASYDTTWIGHHDDFADILSALNKNKQQPPKDNDESEERAKKMSIELSSKSLKRRIHYQKFTRAKDTSNYTDKDKSAILGIGLKRTKADPEEDKNVKNDTGDEKKEQSTDSAPNTTVSSVSVGDYFAAKMAALKNKQKAAAVEVKQEEPESKTEIKSEIEIKQDVEEEVVETSEEERCRRKREKKEAKRRAAMQIVNLEIKEEIVEEVIVKEEVFEEETEQERAARKAQRKEEKRLRKEAKKRAFEMDEEEIAEEAANPEEPKKKRRKIKEEVEE